VYISWWPSEAETSVGAGPFIYKSGNRQGGRTYHQDKVSELSNSAQAALRAGSDPRPGQVKESPSDPAHLALWIKKPDETIDVPAYGGKKVSLGLDAMAIYSWWKIFNAAPYGPWAPLRRNCAKVVAAALDAGGASRIVPMPRTVLWRPTVLEAWVREIV